VKSLVIGSTSSIGRAIATSLASLGEVRTAGRRDADFLLDLSSADAVPFDVGQFDTVVLSAAAFGGITTPALIQAEQVNAVGTLLACHFAEQCQAKHIILLSSVWANCTPGSPDYNIYALSKRHAEELAALFCKQHGIDLTILRPSQVYDSVGACRKHQGLLYSIAENARRGGPVTFYGNHDARRNYLHLDDLVEMIARIAQRRVAGQFNCVHPESPRLSEIALAAFDAYEKKPVIQFLVEQPDIIDRLILPADDALHDAIDYTPRIDMRAGMRLIRQKMENMQ